LRARVLRYETTTTPTNRRLLTTTAPIQTNITTNPPVNTNTTVNTNTISLEEGKKDYYYHEHYLDEN